MRKSLAVVAAAALAGSGVLVSIAATGGTASATKTPVAATCAAVTGSTTVAAATSQPLLSAISGCTSSDTKVTAQALDVSSLNSGSVSAGSGTIYFTNGKSTTYTFTVASTSGLSCPTFEGQTANEQEILTITVTGGKAKITANGGFNVCAYVDFTDGSVYESSIGPVTL